MEVRYRVKCEITPDKNIRQTVECVVGDMHDTIMHSIFRLQEQQVKDTLKRLGWTPPLEELNSGELSTLHNRVDAEWAKRGQR